MADVAAPPAVGDRVPDPAKTDRDVSGNTLSDPSEIKPASRFDSQHPSQNDAAADKMSSRATSQPMSKQPSSSSHNDSSAKDDAGVASYGTRSRKRPGAARPNYAEDQDVDFELAAASKMAGPSRSVSHDSASASRATSEAARPQTTLRLTTNTANGNVPSTLHADAATDSGSEKKKRKPERSVPPKPLVNGANSAAARDIPGTSHFSASPQQAEMPLSKRRRTGEDGIGSLSARRKSSGSHAKGLHHSYALITFDLHPALDKQDRLLADDGTTYKKDDSVYLICEPPGDPYYLCRIMDFRTSNPDDRRSPVVGMLVNWFYRPRDISRYSSDPRFLYASMQSDEVPLNSLRGKCFIKHRSEIKDLDEYRARRDSFWFMQLYDRYSRRPYEMVPASSIINVPPNIKKAIDDQWKFLVLEPARQKELTSAVKLCKRCGLYCAPEKSVDCGVCRDTYHMTCVNPPLSRKPSRGFAWSCGPCSRAQERRLEERHTTVIEADKRGGDPMDEDEPEVENPSGAITPMPDIPDTDSLPEQPPEQVEVAKSNMWPWRYLGLHCKIDDVLQYDDRAIYPRASSRLGTRHQADVRDWFGRPVKLLPPSTLVKKFKGFGKGRDPKVSKEVQAQWAQEKAAQKTRPGWQQDEPSGYVARGEDYDGDDPRCTATPLFVKPEVEQISGFAAVNAKKPGSDRAIDDYMDKARRLGKDRGLVTISKKGDPQISSNFLDQALKMLQKHKFNADPALRELSEHHSKKEIKDPDFNETEMKKFEDGVGKYGSDLRSVRKNVKTKPHGDIVRMYYTWKFSRRGDEIWGGNVGRRSVKRRAETSWVDLADDEDDSAFDNDKISKKNRRFHCKHCGVRYSRQWRRAPNVAPGATVLADPKGGKEKANQLVVALCNRCALLWRRYAMYWTDPEETAKSFVQTGGRQWKKKQEEDLLREMILANELAGVPTTGASAAAAANMGYELTVPIEAAKKKSSQPANEATPPAAAPQNDALKKKAAPVAPPPAPPKEPTPPPEPSPPKKRDLPCSVCRYLETPAKDQKLECTRCRLNVHKNCYGITDAVNSSHWVCDTCLNDKKQQYLLRYECAACPVVDRTIEFFEPPKVSHKKKTDREREKERQEKLLAQSETDAYFKSQRKLGRPQYPREALKLTENSSWMHVVCATWLPEIKFSNAVKLQRAEGMAALVNTPRTEQVCKLCKRPEKAVVTCQQCHAPFHVMCAHDAGYTFGFDISPVKGSRKDPNYVVSLGSETGSMTAAIWCKEHSPKSIVHDITEVVDSETGLTALQLFTETYKQADLTLTGTARKANLLAQSTKLPILSMTTSATDRRASTLPNGDKPETSAMTNGETDDIQAIRRCKDCETDAALKWHKIDEDTVMVNGDNSAQASPWQCHRCYKKSENAASSPPEPKPAELAAPKPLDETLDLFRRKPPAWKASDPEGLALQQFADELKRTTITLTNPKFGGLHVFRGESLNLDLDSDPRSAFRLVIYQASVRCGYDQERDVIITEDGSWVTFPKSMMQALVKMIVAGSREGHWRVVSAREVPCKLMANVYIGPVNGGGPPTNSAPFPPHLAPPSFGAPLQGRETLATMFRPPPPNGVPIPLPNYQSPHPPNGYMVNGQPRPPLHAPPVPSMSASHPPPSGPHGSPPAPPGYQPAAPRPSPGQLPLTQTSPPPGSAQSNGAPGPSSQREGSAAASNSPNVMNLLGP